MFRRKPKKEQESTGLNDISNLARHLAGFDPGRYFDRQAEDAISSAKARWPVLAKLLELDAAGTSDRRAN